MRLVQQRLREILVAVDAPSAGAGAPDAAGDRGEHVERAVRPVARQAGNGVQRIHHQIAPAAIAGHLRRHVILRPVQRGGGGGLAHGGHARRGLALHVGHCPDEPHGSGAETDAPAGHGVGLGHAADGEDAIGKLRHHGGQGRVRVALVEQARIHVVGHDPHMRMTQQHRAECRQIGTGQRRPGRIVRRVQHQPARRRRDRRFQILRAQAKAVVLRTGHEHRRRVAHLRHQRVGRPVRRRDQHLAAGFRRGEQRVEDHLLAAVADDDLVGPERQPLLAEEHACRRVLQRARAVLRRILGVAAQRRRVRRLDGVRRGGEIRLANGQEQHVMPGVAQRAGADGLGDGGGDLGAAEPARERRHRRQRRPAQNAWMRWHASRRLSVSVA